MNKTIFANSEKGVSLIELILYFALLSIVLIIATDLMIKSGEFGLEAAAKDHLLADARFINSRFSNDIHQADSITTPTNLGDTSPTLVLTVGSETHTYTISNSNLEYEKDDGVTIDTANLNSTLTKINSLSFERVGNSSGNHTIKIVFEIEDVRGEKGKIVSKTFETSVGVR